MHKVPMIIIKEIVTMQFIQIVFFIIFILYKTKYILPLSTSICKITAYYRENDTPKYTTTLTYIWIMVKYNISVRMNSLFQTDMSCADYIIFNNSLFYIRILL